MFGTNQTRQTARNQLAELIRKLGQARPTDDLPREDIRSIRFYLEQLDDELKREMKEAEA